MIIKGVWQRRWDSNPRDPFRPIPLAGGRLRPLGHVSVDPSSGELHWGQAGFTLVLQHFQKTFSLPRRRLRQHRL